jgi:5'-nucleotidase
VKPYHVFEEHELALIAVTTDTNPSISNLSDSTMFSDPISTTQYWVNYIHANEPKVKRVVLMTHVDYEVDLELATKTKGVYAIVGAHSHTLLLGEPKKLDNGTYDNTGQGEDAKRSYPSIVINEEGEEVFVVTAYVYSSLKLMQVPIGIYRYRCGEYLGHISLSFNSEGKVDSYVGAPIHLVSFPSNDTDTSTTQDADLAKKIKEWRGPFEEYALEVLGSIDVLLDQTTCRTRNAHSATTSVTPCWMRVPLPLDPKQYRASSTQAESVPPSHQATSLADRY